jgi:hypothetical protein
MKRLPVTPSATVEVSVSTTSDVQLLAPPVGSVERTAMPFAPTATHSLAVAQEMAVSRTGCEGVLVVQCGVAVPGSLEMTIPPPSVVATHSVAVGHEMSVNGSVVETGVLVQALAPPVGSVVVQTLPW